ncbi:MAG: VWA domain-containing protein [Planctomycetes bacterium]|nr:VWA domain-containing protein [Planctomycetota bacterium]
MSADLGWLGLSGVMLLDPWFLLTIPCALLALLWRSTRPRASLPTAAAVLFAAAGRTLRQRLAWLPQAGKVAAAVCLGVALARPVQRDVLPLREQGIDIVLVVDTSSSMLATDMERTQTVRRMDAARQRAEEFAAARTHDRVGLVAFARYAELRCPLTLDERALGSFLAALDTVPQGSEIDLTAIGTAVAKGVQVLGKGAAKSKVVVLLTDGEETVWTRDPEAAIAPMDAAKLAKDAGVRVHTIGLGNGVPDAYGYRPPSFRDLRAIAQETGGQFFQPRSDADLAEVYARIDELEKVELEDPRYRTVDRFEWPLGCGLALLLLALLAEVLVFRRTP